MSSSPALSPSVFDVNTPVFNAISTQDPDEWCANHHSFVRLCANLHVDASRELFESPPAKRIRRVLDFGPSNYYTVAAATVIEASPQAAPEPEPTAAASETATESAGETVPETPVDYKEMQVGGVLYASNDGYAGLARVLANTLERTQAAKREVATKAQRLKHRVKGLKAEVHSSACDVERMLADNEVLRLSKVEVLEKLAIAEAAVEQAAREESLEVSTLKQDLAAEQAKNAGLAKQLETGTLKNDALFQHLKVWKTLAEERGTANQQLRALANERSIMANERGDLIKCFAVLRNVVCGMPNPPLTLIPMVKAAEHSTAQVKAMAAAKGIVDLSSSSK